MSDNNASTPPADDEKSGASKKFIGSAVVVTAIVVLGLILSLTNIFGGQTEPTANPSAPSPSTATATATPTPQPEASVCGLEEVEMSGTVTKAPTATWSLVGTTAAPAIEGQGPGKIDDDGFRSCYARTPTGALLAASNLLAMGSEAPLLGPKMNERLTVPGPGRDAAMARPPVQVDSSGVRIQIAGFRINRYDGNTADVDIAIRTSTGVIAAQVFTLKWVEGDWKVVLADSGDLPSPMSQLPSLSGYVAWSGA